MKKMMNYFIKYDQDFEYGADLPEIFIKSVYDTHMTSHDLTCHMTVT